MTTETMSQTVTVYPQAKINLGLYIVGRRPDGYHNLETVFMAIPLNDTLSVTPSHADRFTLDGMPLQGDPSDNLVLRTLNLLRQTYHIPPLDIHLHKTIPSGAGLGGGSSDAAAMMKLLNEQFALGLTADQMEQLITPLGADCPFFIRQRPTLATGIGNIFTPIDLSLSGWHIALVKPDVFVSTRDAYAHVRPATPAYDLRQTIQRPVEEWRATLFNDFETSVFPQFPTVQQVKEQLYSLGATYACMSGSGSSVFGLFRSKPQGIDTAFPDAFTFVSAL